MTKRPYKRRAGSARTQERLEAFLALWSRPGPPPEYDDVLVALNTIGGGPHLTRPSLVMWRSELRLRPLGRRGFKPRLRDRKEPNDDAQALVEQQRADGFVGAGDLATREGRQAAVNVAAEPVPWSAVANYAALNGIKPVGTEDEVLAKVNALRMEHHLPRWAIVPDRRVVPEEPFPRLVAPGNGRDEAYVARVVE